MRIIYACLLSIVWFTIPASVSANTWLGFGASWMDREGGSTLLFDQNSVIQTVADHRLGRDDRFGMDERVRSSRETKESRVTAETDRNRSHEPARSGNTPQSFSDVRDQSSNSVHSPSHHPDPWWGRRVEGDPMIRGLNRSSSGK
ncbi:MAG TPA: hypothetical protein DDY39_18455 [Nitrospira sp.]|nr:hypothetical protein [Nitrospira sp.]HBR51335.1 hypothetical protein [Nitrospira sp.]